MKHYAILHDPQQGYQCLLRTWELVKPWLVSGHKLELRISPERRNSEQNALLWVWLTAFSAQLQWPVNGAMVKLTAEEWKDVLSAAFKRESQRVAMGLDGGMVLLGLRTSEMGKREFAEFMEFVMATAALRGVNADQAAFAQSTQLT
jgi:NinB protein